MLETVKRNSKLIYLGVALILAYVFVRRGDLIDKLKSQLTLIKIEKEVAVLQEKAKGTKDEYEKTRSSYLDLRKQRPDIFGSPTDKRGPDQGV